MSGLDFMADGGLSLFMFPAKIAPLHVSSLNRKNRGHSRV